MSVIAFTGALSELECLNGARDPKVCQLSVVHHQWHYGGP